MTSREIMDRAIHFRSPQRVGMTLPKPFPDDIAWAGPAAHPDFKDCRRTEGDAEYWLDEWGCTWYRLGGITKGEVIQGAITDWDQFDTYKVPDWGLDARWDRARSRVADNPDKYLIAGLPGGWFFAAARYIRKMENYLCDVLLEPARVKRLNDMIIAANETVIRKAAEIGAQAVMAGEDWGTQTQTLVSPATFREVFKPGIAHLCGLAGKLGLARIMHSCGAIDAIMPDLIDAGVDVFQFDAPALHGIDHLNDTYGGRVAFWCPVDTQRTLQSLDRERIRAEAGDLCRKLGGHNGGFIAGCYGDDVGIGLEPWVQKVACEAFVEFAEVPPKGTASPAKSRPKTAKLQKRHKPIARGERGRA